MDIDEDDDISSLSYVTLAEYIIDEYGYDKIIELIDKKNIEKCLGKTKDEIENDWISYVKLIYAKEGFDASIETEHFIIQYNEEDKEIADKVSQIGENNYDKVTKSFNVNMSEKYNIMIYPTWDLFYKSYLHDTNLGHGTKSVTGYFTPDTNKINILSPNDLDGWSLGSSLESLVIHEFTHAVIMQINPDIPIYLNEGTATYVANQMESLNFFTTVVPAIVQDTFPSVDTIENMQPGDYRLYGFGCAFVMYIAENYGYEKLTEFIKTPDIQTVFGVTKEQFQNDMLESLKKIYVK